MESDRDCSRLTGQTGLYSTQIEGKRVPEGIYRPKDPVWSKNSNGLRWHNLRFPARSPNLNSYAERWVRSVKEECLSRLILVGESSLRRALQQYIVHYHEERNHQGKGSRILFPFQTKARRKEGAVRCRERLGGLLKYYEREAA
jgi:hypothetical protein